MEKIILFGKTAIRFFRDADMLLLALSLVSAIYGVVLISNAASALPNTEAIVSVQIGAIVIGVFLFILFSYVDIDILADKSRLLFVFSLLFIATLIVWGEGDHVGRRAWLRFFGIGIQPAEIVKIPFIIIMAKMMSMYKEEKTLSTFFSLLKMGIVFIIMFVFVLYISEDLGTALMYFGMFIIMLFIAGLKLRWFAIGGALLVAASPLLWNMLSYTQQTRIRAPFFPDEVDPTGWGVLWQTHQSVRAISAGGFTGQGLGSGRFTQGGLIPEQHTDFIFAAAGEELGFIGGVAIIALMIVMIVRCIRVGVKSNNTLGLLVCTGIAGMLIVQTITNLGMTIGFLPVIGVTLPFFSYGGSSIVTCFAAMGIVSGIKMRPKPVRFRTF